VGEGEATGYAEDTGVETRRGRDGNVRKKTGIGDGGAEEEKN